VGNWRGARVPGTGCSQFVDRDGFGDGRAGALSFDPFDSFEQMEKPVAEWGAIYAAHPELGRLQAQIMTALTSQRTVIAVRRDDLSYRASRIDLSKARFMAGSGSAAASWARGGF